VAAGTAVIGIGASRYAYDAPAYNWRRLNAVEKPQSGGPQPQYACFMAPLPLPPKACEGRPSRWRRWVIDALFYFDRSTIGDWVSLVVSDLERPNGASPVATARHTVQLMGYTADIRSAARTLAAHGHPASRALLVDAALDLNSALESLCSARDSLLKVAGAQRITNTDE
jgi:hypothetical protein